MKLHTRFALLCALAFATQIARADLVHRWSFNNPSGSAAHLLSISDSIGSAPAVVTGTGATFTGTALRLPGSGSTTTPGNQAANVIPAYIDLPNGIISSKTNLTVEIWATPVAALTNQRLIDFGRMSVNPGVGSGAAVGEVTSDSTVAPGTTSATNIDNINLNISRGGTNLNLQRLETRINGGSQVLSDTAVAVAPNVENHYVLVFEDGVGSFGATGGRVSWFLNEAPVASIDVSFRLVNMEDVNNWLGRSQFTADALARVDYNEVRIYNHALNQAEIAASRAAGPNPAGVPVLQPDAVTINAGRKAAIAVRANDTNAVSIEVVSAPGFGTAVPDAFGRIRYTHTTGSPASDSFTYRARNAAGWSAPVTVTVNFSSNLRLTTPMLNVPATPPPTAYQVVEAFGTLGFTDPTVLTSPPGETRRLFVGQKGGLLRVIPDVTAATPTAVTFLDLPTLLTSRNERLSSQSEQGLLGVAFHPDYATNGFLYVLYSVDKIANDGNNTLPIYNRLSRFTVQTGNPNAANTASELILLEQYDEAGNHNGGDIHFGPDGYLYISTGDEGNQNDSLNNSQTITKDFHCAVLRIDVDKKPGNLEPNAHPNPAESSPAIDAIPRDETAPGSGVFRARYSIPIDNPFVTVAQGGTWDGTFNGVAISAGSRPYVRSEFFATGFRNPWRMSFDPPTGDLWVGDVGGSAREEIDIVVKGANYGWAFREGFINGPKSAQAPANFDTLYGTRPIHDYQRVAGPTGGTSITGGFVYRGSRFPSLVGAYIFADYVSGNIWSIRRSGPNGATAADRIAGEGGITAFGRDPSNGDILLADFDNDRIRRLVGGVPASGYPETLGETGVFADLADLAPNPGLVSYEVNLPFWSDHGVKRRWFTIPEALGTMTWSRDGVWTFPTGQVWVKHFALPPTRSNPPLATDPLTPAKRIATRLLVKTATGSYGVSYRWNDAGTDATLVADEGAEFDVNLTQNGSPYVQRWRIPSRADCLTCHTPQGGHALSSNTRQLNLSGSMNGFAGNQISRLQGAGYFSNTPESPNLLPRHLGPNETAYPVEARVRSYLAVNCAYCHKSGGTGAPAAWDGRPELTLDQTGLINGPAANNGGTTSNKLIVPGSTTHSIVLNRVAVTNGFTRMPPLGSNELDQTNIALLTQWIGSSALINRQTYANWRLANFNSSSSPEGEPTANPDGDVGDNTAEFLWGTQPLNGGSFFTPQVGLAAGSATVTFNLPANRSATVETSTDLTTWWLWDVPGNGGLPLPGGPFSLTGPALGPKQFFKVRTKEN